MKLSAHFKNKGQKILKLDKLETSVCRLENLADRLTFATMRIEAAMIQLKELQKEKERQAPHELRFPPPRTN